METEIKNGNELMFDHSMKMYVRIRMSADKKSYEQLVSKDKKKWVVFKTFKSMDEVIGAQQELINNNYKNLFKLITKV